MAAEPKPKLIFVVTEDWFFWSHRRPMAQARDPGIGGVGDAESALVIGAAGVAGRAVSDRARRIGGRGFWAIRCHG
jgi:hypothetical protein